MNIDNIKIGEIYNYTQLCIALEEKAKSGNSRYSHIKQIRRYLKLTDIRKKFLVEEIYSIPLPEQINKGNTAPYTELIKKMLLILLMENNNKVSMSMSKLAKKIGLINSNFHICDTNKKYILEEFGIDFMHTADFVSKTRSAYDGCITTALKQINKEKIAVYETAYFISQEITEISANGKKKKVYENRKATEYEVDRYLSISNKLLDEYGCSYPQLNDINKKNEYDKELKSLLKLELDITNIYTSHILTTNNDAISKHRYLLRDKKNIETELSQLWIQGIIKRGKKGIEAARKVLESEDFIYATKMERSRADTSYEYSLKLLISIAIQR